MCAHLLSFLQWLKLPKQTRVTPDEYREFLSLGHGEIFTLDLDRVLDAPWRAPNANPSDFFNYGMNERGWRHYCRNVEQYRWGLGLGVGVGAEDVCAEDVCALVCLGCLKVEQNKWELCWSGCGCAEDVCALAYE